MRIFVQAATGQTLYISIEKLNGNTFRTSSETFTGPFSWATHGAALTAQTAELAGTYYLDVDPSTWEDGLYNIRVHDNTGSHTTLSGQLMAIKNGGEVQIGEEGVNNAVYHAAIEFTKDPVNNADEYTVTWFRNGIQLTSGLTSPLITVIKRTDGSTLIASTAMTAVGAGSGMFKFDTTSAGQKQTAGEAYLAKVSVDVDGRTRQFADILGRDAA